MTKPEYISKQLAAESLGLSPRRLLEISQTGQIKRRYARDPVTKRRQAIFRAADVARLADEIASRKCSVRPEAAARSESAALSHIRTVPPALPQLERPARPWLTVDEAADYTGLPASFLASMIAAGKLAALDVGVRAGGRWRVNRRDLDGIKGVRSGRG